MRPTYSRDSEILTDLPVAPSVKATLIRLWHRMGWTAHSDLLQDCAQEVSLLLWQHRDRLAALP